MFPSANGSCVSAPFFHVRIHFDRTGNKTGYKGCTGFSTPERHRLSFTETFPGYRRGWKRVLWFRRVNGVFPGLLREVRRWSEICGIFSPPVNGEGGRMPGKLGFLGLLVLRPGLSDILFNAIGRKLISMHRKLPSSRVFGFSSRRIWKLLYFTQRWSFAWQWDKMSRNFYDLNLRFISEGIVFESGLLLNGNEVANFLFGAAFFVGVFLLMINSYC